MNDKNKIKNQDNKAQSYNNEPQNHENRSGIYLREMIIVIGVQAV